MPEITDAAAYWDAYASGTAEPAPAEPVFVWTQYPDWGPGPEPLGMARTALELGGSRGRGRRAGHQRRDHDRSRSVAGAAPAGQMRWGAIAGVRFVQADVTEFLTTTDVQWDAVYSIWDALWFSDPQRLLPLVHSRLQPAARWCSPTPRPSRIPTGCR